MTVVVGVDGAGRSHRLRELAAAVRGPVVRVDGATDVDLDSVPAEPAAGGPLVIVDDAHRLPDEALRALAAAARKGVPMAISRRPTLDRPALAELDEAVAAHGPVELLGALDDDALSRLIAAATGKAARPEQVAAVRAASTGHALVATAVAGGTAGGGTAGGGAAGGGAAGGGTAGGGAAGGGTAPALAARVQQRLARLNPALAELARVLALRLDLPDDVLAAAAALEPAALAPAMRSIRDEGMLAPGGERMIPAVAQVVLADLPPAQRRRLHDRVAVALVEAGGDPVVAATQLSAARARTGHAAEVYQAAADRLRFQDPAAAITWYDDAVDAGAEPAALAAGRAEAAALLGRPIDVDDAAASPEDTARIALAAGAAAAHQGRSVRAAEALLAADPPGPVLAAPMLVAVGQPDQAKAAASGAGPVPLRRFAAAALAAADPAAGNPADAVPLLIEAAEAIEATPPELVLPDTPHALGAVVSVLTGDTATAEHLLDRAVTAGTGGPVATERHRVLQAWVRMRAGRFDTALAELQRLAGTPLPGREVLLAAALSAGIARRSGDIARLRQAWTGAEPVLARRAVDLFHVEPLEELLVAAARLRQQQRIAPVLDTLEQIVARLGRPVAWAVSLGWIRLHIAVVAEDAPRADSAASDLAAAVDGAGAAATGRQRAQATAAGHWARSLAGQVDPDAVVAAADALAAAQLPWEGSRLAGDAAIRTTDPAAARRLLERARDLAALEAATVEGQADPSYGGLSEREREVARLVLDGRTYREIGAQLYLSPKTVEHHVARIRTKLEATSRAELVAALRRIFGDSTGGRPPS